MTNPTGAVVVLRLVGNTDNPNTGLTKDLRRVQFRPFLLTNSDWTNIGGAFNQLAANSGTDYNFMTGAAAAKSDTSFKVVAELVGFPGDGWGFQDGIRVEIDDVKLTVTDRATPNMVVSSFAPHLGVAGTRVSVIGSLFGTTPSVRFGAANATASGISATNGSVIIATVPTNAIVGKITVVNGLLQASSSIDFWPTSPTNLLADPTFSILTDSLGQHPYWTFFEGARIPNPSDETWAVGEDSSRIAAIPGWQETPYAGFYQEASYEATNGDFFTLSIRAQLQRDFKADDCKLAMRIVEPFTDNDYNGQPDTSNGFTDLNGNGVWDNSSVSVDVLPQMVKNGVNWGTYAATWKVTNTNVLTLLQNGKGLIRATIQPSGRSVNTNNDPTLESSILFDNAILKQQKSDIVGPQIAVKVAAATRTNGETANIFSPLIGYSTPYAIVLQNDGAETLTVSSVSLSGTSFAWTGGSTASLQPGESRTFIATAAPASNSPLTGTLTVVSNDKETADQTYIVKLQTTPVTASDNFNSGTSASLKWVPVYNELTSLDDPANASVNVTNGTLRFDVNSESGAGTYPWYYGAKKVFASPGSIDVVRSTLTTALSATGSTNGTNKVQFYLESLSSSGAATGKISLGQWVDETTTGSDPGVGNYFTPDGTNDRVAVVLPNGGGYTATGGALSSAISQGFNPNAPAFQLVVMMTDFNFGLDAVNFTELDSISLNLVTKPFEVSNGGFESDSSDFEAPLPPTNWLQYPVEGVSKNLVTNNAPVYNASTGLGDTGTLFAAYAGSKSMKIYGQNFYSGTNWVGPSQTGVVYQEWPVAGTAGLSTGEAIHARGAAKVFGIDALTGGSTFKYGFRYMDAANVKVGSDEVTTITASTDVPDKWVPLVANGTIPAGAAKVQLIAEFVQNASTDTGAVYLDDLSVGLDAVAPNVTVGSGTYSLVWSDEFDGSALNTGNWTPETGGGGWGNNEQQTYTSSSTNLRVESGSLVLQAVKSSGSWTSARIKTQDKRSFKYGKIEFRAKLPSGVGPWPAAWMMGTNISTVGWPTCGEIDVMEWRGTGSDSNTVGHALHSPSRNGSNPVQPTNRSSVTNPSTQFHTYAVVWNSNNMVFSVDGVDKATLTPPTVDAGSFRQDFFMILNLAMGGDYLGGTPIDSALTNATYEVDYLRVYQDPLANVVPSDTTPPVITIAGSNPVSVAWGSSYSDAGATAFDAGDNVAVPVVTNNPVNTSVPGTYSVLYTATDSKTNSASTNRTVTVAMANGGTNVGSDGLSDISRYAFGGTNTNPLSRNLMPVQTTTNSAGINQLVLTYFARTNTNVTTVPVLSTNLGSSTNWTTSGVTVTNLQNLSTNGTVLQMRQATTPMTGSQKFLRLKSVLTP
jgi:beta-glucanase (GH16 family)